MTDLSTRALSHVPRARERERSELERVRAENPDFVAFMADMRNRFPGLKLVRVYEVRGSYRWP